MPTANPSWKVVKSPVSPMLKRKPQRWATPSLSLLKLGLGNSEVNLLAMVNCGVYVFLVLSPVLVFVLIPNSPSSQKSPSLVISSQARTLPQHKVLQKLCWLLSSVRLEAMQNSDKKGRSVNWGGGVLYGYGSS